MALGSPPSHQDNSTEVAGKGRSLGPASALLHRAAFQHPACETWTFCSSNPCRKGEQNPKPSREAARHKHIASSAAVPTRQGTFQDTFARRKIGSEVGGCDA